MSQTNGAPFFSVVISAYNGERYLPATLDSVIGQTISDWEVIVVDDASSDRTSGIAAEYAAKNPKIRVVRNEENVGAGKSANRGIREARGTWIVRLDSDDLLMSDYLATLRSLVPKLPHLNYFVSGWVAVIDGNGAEVLDVRLPSAETITRMMGFENFLYHSGTSFPKQVWEKVGGYPDEDRKLSEDAEMWKRFFKNGISLFMIPERLVHYRIHDSNFTSFKDGQLIDAGDRERARAQQSHEWRVSLFLKQGEFRAARREVLLLKKIQHVFSLKNQFYYFLTFLPKFLVHGFMWEVRPRFRRLAKFPA